MRDSFDNISPIDYRYWDEDVSKYLSERAFSQYKLSVELALIKTLSLHKICPKFVVKEVEKACGQITMAEVQEEEKKIRHDIRALVNCIRRRVSDKAKPYVHMTATSYDIVDSASSARYRDVVDNVLVPALIKLEGSLIAITLREADTVQIGRTHGQHAIPITFGFAMAGFVSRLGQSIEIVQKLVKNLPGKFSGAVGSHNASSLFFKNPEAFERDVLSELGLKPAEHSTQIIPPESGARLFCEMTIIAGILANLSDDMRNLQRTEIGEIGELFESEQVGSSTMPQKRNPINFESVKSCWKIILPRIVTVFMDQISEHQRDLTNSASARTYGEIITYIVSMAKKLTKTMDKISVDHVNLKRNLDMQNGLSAAEPLYIILASMGHPDAHEKVRGLTLEAERAGLSFREAIEGDKETMDYFERMTDYQRQIILSPSLYIGIASKKARAIGTRWKRKFNL